MVIIAKKFKTKKPYGEGVRGAEGAERRYVLLDERGGECDGVGETVRGEHYGVV